jgi:hypothetical protein
MGLRDGVTKIEFRVWTAVKDCVVRYKRVAFILESSNSQQSNLKYFSSRLGRGNTLLIF